MELYVDDQPVTLDAGSPLTLQQVIEQARAEVDKKQRVIVGVQCDGRELAGPELDAQLPEPATDFKRIDLLSTRADKLVRDALDQAITVLEETSGEQEKTAALFTEGKTAEAAEALGECIGQWMQIHQSIAYSAAFLNLDTNVVMVDDQPLEALLNEVCDQLRQIKEVLQVGDHVLLADILQYEFETIREKWRAAIECLRELTAATQAT